MRLLWASALPADYRARLPVRRIVRLADRIDWAAETADESGDVHPDEDLHSVVAIGDDEIESPVLRRHLMHALVTRRGPHGRPLDEVLWPVIDIRGAADYHRGARDRGLAAGSTAHRAALSKMVAEAAKYVTKDIEYVDSAGGRHLVDPSIYAALYCATDGQRRTSCTMTRRDTAGHIVRPGWWVIEHLQPYVHTCECCGHTGPLECQVERIDARMTRGP